MKRAFLVGLISIMILFSLVPYTPKVKAALSSGTLADAMGTIIGAHSWQPTDGDSQVPHYATIFNAGSSSYYEAAAQLASSYVIPVEVLATKRMAELDGLSSAVSDSTLQAYLSSVTMLGNVPSTYNGYFLIYHRFEAHAYDWAAALGLGSRWNKQAALQQIDTIIRTQNPYGALDGPESGPGTYIGYTQNQGWITYYRYYDDTAETIEWLLEVGGSSYLSTCDLIWNFQNSGFDVVGNLGKYSGTGPYGYFWNGQYYDYDATSLMETCVGYFALISGRYLATEGKLGTYGSRIVSDLNQKLLISGYGSPQWDGYTLDHVPGRGEHRLPETVAAWAAMQAYYPIMTSTMQNTLQGMGSVGWRGLLGMPNFDASQNMFRNYVANPLSMGATGEGLMIMFLNGIVPKTGSLAVPLNDEGYSDRGFEFPGTMFNFNYAGHSIRIPVNAGTLNFIFGSGIASYNFPSTGVYQVQFSSDWNTVQSASLVGSLDSKFKYISGGSSPPPTTGTISVTSTYNTTPIGGVSVTVSGPTSTTVTTSASGSVSTGQLSFGSYTLTASYNGQQLVEGATITSSNPSASVNFPFTSVVNPTGTIRVYAEYGGQNIAVQVTGTGPNGWSQTGTTSTTSTPLTYTSVPASATQYQFSGSYNNVIKTASVTVTNGGSVDAILDFGGGNDWWQWLTQNPIVIAVAVAAVGIIGGGTAIGLKRAAPAQQLPPRRKGRRRH